MMADEAKPKPVSEQNNGRTRRRQSWLQRFAVASRGIKIAVRTEVSFLVHLFAIVVVVVAAWALGISRLEWCLLVICIALVFAAELLNTAIERLALAITCEEDNNIRDALDIASGAVLAVALAALILGAIIFGWRIFF